jgi:hypothetical protein
MSGEGYRTLLRCRSWSDTLRLKKFTWDQIADVMALGTTGSPLRLYRLAHGRTAGDVLAAINDLDPAGTAPMGLSRLYDFEMWPAGGRRPTARILVILAQIYQTKARNLVTEQVFATYKPHDRDVIDRADFCHFDPFQPVTPCSEQRAHVNMEEKNKRVRPQPETSALCAEECSELLRAVSAEEADMKRRQLLFELALVLGGAPALPLLRRLTPDEEDRLTRAVRAEGKVDAHTVTTIEKLSAECHRLDDMYGPAKVLTVIEAQRELVAGLLRDQSLTRQLRNRLIHTYAELSEFTGFLHYDQMDYARAVPPLRDALQAALEIDDATLAAYIHHWRSDMASLLGRPGEALDHALAAQSWARRSGSNLIKARTEYSEARALSLTGQERDSLRRLDAATAWATRPASAEPAYLYWVSESMGSSGSGCFVFGALGRSTDVIDAASIRLRTLSTEYSRQRAFGLLHYGIALTQQKEIPEATAKLGEAATIMRTHSSARLTHLLTQARLRLEPWARNANVRSLDEKLSLVVPPDSAASAATRSP